MFLLDSFVLVTYWKLQATILSSGTKTMLHEWGILLVDHLFQRIGSHFVLVNPETQTTWARQDCYRLKKATVISTTASIMEWGGRSPIIPSLLATKGVRRKQISEKDWWTASLKTDRLLYFLRVSPYSEVYPFCFLRAEPPHTVQIFLPLPATSIQEKCGLDSSGILIRVEREHPTV